MSFQQYKKNNIDVNVKIKIMKSNLLHAWLHGVDLKICKKRPITFK